MRRGVASARALLFESSVVSRPGNDPFRAARSCPGTRGRWRPCEALLTCGPWPRPHPGGEGGAEWTGSGAQAPPTAGTPLRTTPALETQRLALTLGLLAG